MFNTVFDVSTVRNTKNIHFQKQTLIKQHVIKMHRTQVYTFQISSYKTQLYIQGIRIAV